MKVTIFLFTLFMLIQLSISLEAETVDIPDTYLRAALETALGKTAGDSITEDDMATLTRLRVQNSNIIDLTGLEAATNLTYLNLWNNNITGISPLSGLTKLTDLQLNKNRITDISPIKKLTKLTNLQLYDNSITDISPIKKLTKLTTLALSKNYITDISPIRKLTKLTTLALSNNPITDISPIRKLTKLISLRMEHNSVTDISLISGLTNLTYLYLEHNSITDTSPLAGLTNLTYLGLDNNPITDILALVSNAGLGNEDIVDVSDNPLSANSVAAYIPALKNRGVTVHMTHLKPVVNILDSNLRAAIERTLGKTAGDSIIKADMATLTSLQALRVNISDLTGLETAYNLTDLNLMDNSITDISLISGLTNLTTLTLMENSITDILPIAELTNLVQLSLADNKISDISPLVSNTGLGNGDTVDVSENPLSPESINIHIPALQTRGVTVTADSLQAYIPDSILRDVLEVALRKTGIDPIITKAEMRTLTRLEVTNFLSDLTGLEAATNLTFLNLSANRITNISPITALTRLTELNLSGNSITDISPLSGLTNLTNLQLNKNRITDISPLVSNTGLGNEDKVDVSDNPLSAASINTHIPALQAKGVTIRMNNFQLQAPAAPSVDLIEDTPVLGVSGSIVDQTARFNKFRVTVKNLSNGKAVTGLTIDADGVGYQLTLVDDVRARQAATIGDILEISAQSPNPLVGVQPVRYIVTTEDVRRGWIQLEALVAYEIPAATELLPNYPNPFNPETWIPFRLAEDASVTLTIYDEKGRVVRTFDVGHRRAAVYESRSQAVYWDGRNAFGETVSSGVYFYHLSADDYSATRRMLILK